MKVLREGKDDTKRLLVFVYCISSQGFQIICLHGSWLRSVCSCIPVPKSLSLYYINSSLHPDLPHSVLTKEDNRKFCNTSVLLFYPYLFMSTSLHFHRSI